MFYAHATTLYKSDLQHQDNMGLIVREIVNAEVTPGPDAEQNLNFR